MATNKPIKIDFQKLHDWALPMLRTYAIRHCAPVSVGDELDPSVVWEDGNPTDETLGGTCALSLDHHVRFPKDHLQYKSFGPAYLVTGDPTDDPCEDIGEVVLRNCRVVAVLDLS